MRICLDTPDHENAIGDAWGLWIDDDDGDELAHLSVDDAIASAALDLYLELAMDPSVLRWLADQFDVEPTHLDVAGDPLDDVDDVDDDPGTPWEWVGE